MKKTTSKTTGTTPEFIEECKREELELCTLTFGNEDMNKLVEYINKITSKLNKCQ